SARKAAAGGPLLGRRGRLLRSRRGVEDRAELDLLELLLLEDGVERAKDARLLRAADVLAGEGGRDRLLSDRAPAAGLLGGESLLLLGRILAFARRSLREPDLAILQAEPLELGGRHEDAAGVDLLLLEEAFEFRSHAHFTTGGRAGDPSTMRRATHKARG